MRNLQIVNGGQTTASLHRSRRTNFGDVAAVAVQAKITEVEGDLLDELVPKISEYANSQNKVQMADLSSNLPFHIELESLSRNTWAPATSQTSRQTKWFYERARGQYSDAMNRAGSRAEFQKMHPPKQRFSKVELATFENTWDLEPHEVSRGAQKNFHRFMVRVGARDAAIRPDVTYFQRAVAKAILFRRAEVIVRLQQFGGYRRNIVTYALARLAHATGQRLDLIAIWNAQESPDAVDRAIEELAHIAYRVLTDPDRPSANVTEWAKRLECWERMLLVQWRPRTDLDPHLIASSSSAEQSAARSKQPSPQEAPTIAILAGVSGDTFLAIEAWAKQTDNLTSFKRELAHRIGIALKQGKELTSRQRPQAVDILQESRSLGYVDR